MTKQRNPYLFLLACTIALCLLALPALAYAGEITVDTTDDVIEAANCSLREAVQAANIEGDFSGCTISGSAPFTINVPANVYTLAIAGSGEDANISGDLDIVNTMNILGDGPGDTIIEAGGTPFLGIDRIFHITGTVDVMIEGVTIRNGQTEAGGNGGGIANMGANLMLVNSEVTNNAALGTGPGNGGGGILNMGGSLVLTDTAVISNTAEMTLANGGGILNGPGSMLSITGGSITENLAARAGGGLENNDGSAMLIDTALDNNIARINGGGMHISAGGTFTMTGGTASGNVALMEGGALWNSAGGLLTVDGVNIEDNVAAGDASDQGGGGIFSDGGDLFVLNSNIEDNMATGASGSGGGIFVSPMATADLSGSTLSGNSSMRAGGGIEILATITDTATVMVMDTDFSSNSTGSAPGNGGAMHITGPAMVTVTGGTVISNTAAAEGGGLWNSVSGSLSVIGTSIENNTASGADADQGGGGLFNDGGTMFVSGVSLLNNVADGASGSGGGLLANPASSVSITGTMFMGNTSMRAGGGIEINATVTDPVDAVIDGSGFVSNSTGDAPGNGGALHITGPASVIVRNSLVSENTAAAEGGGLWNSSSGVLAIVNTSIEENTASGDDADQGGGGLFNDGGEMSVSGGSIEMNEADGASGSGGGILVNGGTLTVIDADIDANVSNRAGGGIEATGRAITDTTTVTVTLSNVALTNNVTGDAPGNGGGLHLTADGIVTMTGGNAADNVAGAEGGGLWNSGAGIMVIDGVLITENVASGDDSDQGGGGLFNDGGAMSVVNSTISNNDADGASGSGGGILNNGGELSVVSTTIVGNSASRAGGGIEDNARDVATIVTIDTVMLNMNSTGAAPGNGGGLHMSGPGSVMVSDSMVMTNTAAAEGGGLWNSDSGMLTVDGTTLSANVASGADADQGGGALFNDGGTLMVMNSTLTDNVADGASGSGGGILNNGGTLSVSDTTISGNTANRAGGGIEDNAADVATMVTLDSIMLNENMAGDAPGNGGGLHITGMGTVSMTNSTVMLNMASSEGGGLWNSAVGSLMVDKSLLSGNRASGSAEDNGGGALFNDGGSMMVSNSTLSGNSAVSTGGGILNVAGTTGVTNVTVYENEAEAGASGLANLDGATLNVVNSIIAHLTTTGMDCMGVTAGDFNLATDASCGASLTGDPLLGPLADNGGDTATHMVMDGSPALDAGDNAVCAAAPINNMDQRGATRPFGDVCDLGAYEGGAPVGGLFDFFLTPIFRNDDTQ